MRTLITAQQTIFYTQNGYIELAGIPVDAPSFFQEIEKVLQKRKGTTYEQGRDLWRDSSLLKTHLTKTLKPTVCSLYHKPLRLALDQWIPKGTTLPKSAFKDLFCIQGFALGFLFAKDQAETSNQSLGISPFPKEKGNFLFLKPTVLVDWPLLKEPGATDLYFVAYAMDASVFIHNPNDPSTHLLKSLGYNFGDRLRSDSHPYLFPPS